MSFNKVSAGSGIQWISSAIKLVMKNPGVFIVMAIITAVISIIPLLGSLVMMIIGPALYGGYIYAANKQLNGEQAVIGDLFTAFNQPGKIGPMVMLCLPTVAAAIVIGILAFFSMGSAILAGMVGGGGDVSAVGIGSTMLVFVLLALAIGLLVFAVIFYAIPRVMLENVEPVQAMKDSFSASLGNIAAMIVFALLLFAASFVLALIPIVGWIALFLAPVPVGGISMYFAYRDVFGLSNTATVTPTDPPQPPPTVE